MNKLKRFALALMFLSGTAAAQSLEDFLHIATIELQGQGALYEAVLTPEAYAAIERPDFGDLRVFNGAGELLPYTLMHSTEAEREMRTPVPLPYFPLYGEAGGNAADLSVRVDKYTDGRVSTVVTPSPRSAQGAAVLGYLFDASALKEPIDGLRFAWTPVPEGTNTRVTIAVSDDLSAWRTVATDVPLLQLRQGEAVLERNSVKTGAVRAKYWRLAWDAKQPVVLQRVDAIPLGAMKEKARSWGRFSAKAGERAGEYLFELNPGLPVDRIRIEAPQSNAIAPISLSVRDSEREPWRLIKTVVAYRFGDAATPDIEAAGSGRYWLLRIDARTGGLGEGMPVLNAGWVPHRVIFNARGEGPFTLAMGNPLLVPAALSPATLIPGYANQTTYELIPAQLKDVAPNPKTTVERKLGRRLGLGDQTDLKQIVLWSVLVLAVLLLAFMAWRLLKQLPKGEQDDS